MEDVDFMVDQTAKHLTGATILRPIHTPEMDFFGFVVRGVNGKMLNVWVQQDPEGNGPGWLSIENEEGEALR